MRTSLLVLLVFGLCTAARAQLAAAYTAASVSTTASTVTYRPLPVFPDGNEGFTRFLQQQLDYPEVARAYGLEGTVVVAVQVQADGKVRVLGLAAASSKPLNQAALRAAAQLPRLLPALQDGRPVVRQLHIPFRFRLR